MSAVASFPRLRRCHCWPLKTETGIFWPSLCVNFLLSSALRLRRASKISVGLLLQLKRFCADRLLLGLRVHLYWITRPRRTISETVCFAEFEGNFAKKKSHYVRFNRAAHCTGKTVAKFPSRGVCRCSCCDLITECWVSFKCFCHKTEIETFLPPFRYIKLFYRAWIGRRVVECLVAMGYFCRLNGPMM